MFRTCTLSLRSHPLGDLGYDIGTERTKQFLGLITSMGKLEYIHL